MDLVEVTRGITYENEHEWFTSNVRKIEGSLHTKQVVDKTLLELEKQSYTKSGFKFTRGTVIAVALGIATLFTVIPTER